MNTRLQLNVAKQKNVKSRSRLLAPLAKFSQNLILVGSRHLCDTEPDADWMPKFARRFNRNGPAVCLFPGRLARRYLIVPCPAHAQPPFLLTRRARLYLRRSGKWTQDHRDGRGHAAPAARCCIIEGSLSPSYLVEHARAHDAAGFDFALVGYSDSSAYHAALHAERRDFLVAHRRFVAPRRTRSRRSISSPAVGSRSHHHRQDRRRASGRRRLQPEGRTLSQGRRISRGDDSGTRGGTS